MINWDKRISVSEAATLRVLALANVVIDKASALEANITDESWHELELAVKILLSQTGLVPPHSNGRSHRGV